MIPSDVISKINREMSAADYARTAGNEAQARVCARRAAGLAIGVYYKSRGETPRETSAIALIRKLLHDPHIDAGWRQTADLLLTRVAKDYSFPIQKDVLAETRRLIQEIADSKRKID